MNIVMSILISSHLIGVDPALMLGLCHTETNLRNVHNMKDGGSPSYGVCQVKYATAKWLYPNIKEKDLKNVAINTLVAATYLKYQIERYDNILKGISAYNAGRHIKGNKRYVNKVLKAREQMIALYK